MRTTLVALAAVAAACLESPAAATTSNCPGDPGYVLDISPHDVPTGTAFDVTIQAPTNSLIVLIASPTEGPTATLWGSLCVGLPAGTFIFVMPAPSVTFPHPIDCNLAYVGIKGYFQFLAASSRSGIVSVHRSNSQSIEIVAGSCHQVPQTGSFVTYTQGGWGQDCNGNNVGCLRDAHFAAVFPNGLILGDPDGIDGDGAKAAHFTTSAAVNAYLPAGGPSGKYSQDYLNPTSTSAGALGAQLTAAKLNVAFDNAGVFDPIKSDDSLKLVDLIYLADVHRTLLGKTVAEVIAIADLAVSGAVAVLIDVDGDSVGDIGYSDLTNALDKLNNGFHDGTVSTGSLGFPAP